MITGLPDFELESYFTRWGEAKHHSFTASEGQTMTIRELLDIAGFSLEVLGDVDLGYRSTFGSDEFRAAVAQTYTSISATQTLSFAGAQEGLFWVLAELLHDGGHAIVTVPNYQSMESVPLSSPADVSGLPLWTGSGADLQWGLDLDRLESLIRPDTKVIAVNFPNNPTGFVPDEATFRALATLCDDRGIHLVSDEVYRGVELDPRRTLPQAADLSQRAISINVMSKSYGLPGLRVGWIATQDAALLAKVERRKHYTSICNPGPSELLATIALGERERLHDRIRRIISSNLAVVTDFFAEFPDLFEFNAPDGGCVAFPRYLGSEGVEVFARRAVAEAGVMMLPASIYLSGLSETPDDRFRVGMGQVALPDSVAVLRAHLLNLGAGSFASV